MRYLSLIDMGFPRYKIGENGVLKSLFIYKIDGSVRWRTMKGCPDTNGYTKVTLSNSKGKETHLIHQLVLFAFRGPCPKGLEGRHLDGTPSNNCLSNLEYGTHTENMADKHRHGRALTGEVNG